MTLGCLLAAQPGHAQADPANNSSLIISQLKVTSGDGQFITLYNATDSVLDMGKYRLEYFNSYDLDKATSSRLIALSGTVPPHGYYMVNDDSLLLCYRLTVSSMSLGLSSTAGMLDLVAFDQESPGGSATSSLQDYVAWSKKEAAGAQTLPGAGFFLQRQPMDGYGGPLVGSPGDGGWQAVRPGGDNPCELITSVPGGTALSAGSGQLLPTAEPPSTILTADAGSGASDTPAMPPGDIGLRAPSVTELLPNPFGTGNDSTDEFIEIYNPNKAAFDLSGFSLQSGTTSLHTFTFPKKTMLAPMSFTAFYAKTTGLSLSNTAGQVNLLDPFGSSVSASAAYSKAKDGIGWALAEDKWYWTTSLTPGRANVVKRPAGKQGSSSKASDKKRASAATGGSGTAGTIGAGTGRDSSVDTSPIHTGSLVLIAALALLYGAYEYRRDLANGIYKLRQHFGARYEDRA